MNIETEQQIILDPYIGPRPFKRDIEDQKRFFGRDDETDEIVSLILGHKIVLIYAQSGTGKTSIFNAQVAPTLEKYGFQVLPTARVGIASDTKSEFNSLNMDSDRISSSSSSSSPRLINFYMLNALQSLKPEIDSKSLLTRSLSSFLKDYFPLNHSNKNNKIKAQVIVFDQLEELFNFYPGSTWRKQQEDFFEQITEALEENPSLRIVLVIREDYLAELDHFTKILPGRLRARYRLERLGKDAALLAIKGPLRAIKTKSSSLNAYSEQEIDNQIEILVEELLKIHVEDPFTGKPHQLNGEFVEPIQLQIVSQRWWQEISSGRPQTTQARLQALADVDSALQEFYEDSVYHAVKNTNICEGIVRRLFEEKLITSTGTRAFVHWGAFAQFIQGANKSISKEKVDEVINILEKKYLIRGEWRSGAKWYELTHDRLIGPIKASNLKWKERERSRKSRRNRMIIIPSVAAAAAAAIAVSMIVVFSFNPFIDSEETLLGRTPSEISVNPETNMIYVSTSDNNPISVIDGKTNEVVDDITLDQPASDISVNPEINMIYAAGYNSSSRSSDSIYVIDGNTKTMVVDISVDKNIIDLSVNPQTNMIYAVGTNSSSFSDSIYVIDGKTNEVVDDIILLNKINSYISINPQTNMIYAVGYNSSSFSNSVSVIDGKTNEVVVDDITLDQPAYEISDQPAYEISVNSETNMIYVTVSDFLYVIDGKTNEVVDDITLDQPAKDISVNPQTNMIYVAVSDSVYVIDGKTMIMVVDISVDKNIIYLSVNPETNMIYVSDSDSNTVYTINGIVNRIDAIVRGPEPPGIKVGKEPSEISVNPETNMIYVSTTSDNNAISVIDGKTNEVDAIRVNKPSYISVNPQTNMIYAVGTNFSSFSDSIYVIDGKTNEVVDDITLDQPAYEISVNPQTNMIYAVGTNFSSFSVSVIDGKTNEVVDDITLDQPASEISVNPQTNMIYVAGSISSYGIGSGSVSVIDGKTNEVVDDITLDQPAKDISVNPQTNMIYVAVSDLGFVYVIDGKTNEVVVDDITLDQPVYEISVNPQTNMIYAVGSGYISSYDIGSGSVSVIDGKTNEVVDDIPLTHIASSEYIDVNPQTNIVYIVSSTSDSVTAMDGTTHQIITN